MKNHFLGLCLTFSASLFLGKIVCAGESSISTPVVVNGLYIIDDYGGYSPILQLRKQNKDKTLAMDVVDFDDKKKKWVIKRNRTLNGDFQLESMDLSQVVGEVDCYENLESLTKLKICKGDLIKFKGEESVNRRVRHVFKNGRFFYDPAADASTREGMLIGPVSLRHISRNINIIPGNRLDSGSVSKPGPIGASPAKEPSSLPPAVQGKMAF